MRPKTFFFISTATMALNLARHEKIINEISRHSVLFRLGSLPENVRDTHNNLVGSIFLLDFIFELNKILIFFFLYFSFQLHYWLNRLIQLVGEPYITSDEVKSWQTLDFLYHLRWILAGHGFYQDFIDKIIITTGYKVYFPIFRDEWAQLIPDFSDNTGLDLSIITID